MRPLTAAAFALLIQAAPQPPFPKEFGPGVTPAGPRAAFTADLNRDGKPDSVWLVKISAAGPDRAIEVANPWRPNAQGSLGRRGIAVVLSGVPERRVLLSDEEYFSSPMWEDQTGNMLSFQKRAAGRPAIAVATESGEDMYLYFVSPGIWRWQAR
jgi:hypothetical protein